MIACGNLSGVDINFTVSVKIIKLSVHVVCSRLTWPTCCFYQALMHKQLGICINDLPSHSCKKLAKYKQVFSSASLKFSLISENSGINRFLMLSKQNTIFTKCDINDLPYHLH